MSVQGQAPTGQPVPPPNKPTAQPGIFERLRNYILDSYNGLYKIVLEPSMPTKQTVILLVVGLLIGLIWGWALSPVQFYDASPRTLTQPYVDLWVKTIAIAHDPVASYDSGQTTLLLGQIPNPNEAINRLAQDSSDTVHQAALQNLQSTVEIPNTPDRVQPSGNPLDGILALLIPILIVAIATPIIVVVWRLLIKDNIALPIQKQVKMLINPAFRDKVREEERKFKEQQDANRRAKEFKDKAAAEAAAEAKAAAEAAAKGIAPAAGAGLGAAVMNTLYLFSKGRSFDESSEIELKTGEFLGQCGAVIAEAVDPDPTAVEVWLFDMFDQVNLKKVLISETAYGNASIRAAVEDSVEDPVNDVIVAAPGAVVTLETPKLRLQAKLSSLAVAPDGRFENFQMEMKAWDKSKMAAPAGAPAPLSFDAPPPPPAARPLAPAPLPPAPVGAPPLSSYDDIQFDPPPVQPLRPAAPLPPAPVGSRPLSDYDDLQFDPPPVQPLRPAAPPPAPLGAPPMSAYDDIQFDPPPVAPRPAPVQPLRPAAPPPPAPGFGDEDDPFGNTGDFTPLGNR